MGSENADRAFKQYQSNTPAHANQGTDISSYLVRKHPVACASPHAMVTRPFRQSATANSMK